jgi:hypothetical protein
MSTANFVGLIQVRSPCRQREAISRTFRRAPIAAKLDSRGFAFICSDFWFDSESRPIEFNIQPGRSDSHDTNWFVALSEEQLALVADNGSHTISFR